MKNPAAVALGSASWKSRKKGKSKKAIKEMMTALAMKRHAKTKLVAVFKAVAENPSLLDTPRK